jgi:E-phenylitaconyl-CoA hydratase
MAIDIELSQHIATITINRPERLNAMDAEHYRLLSQTWTRVRDDPEIRVAIITGAGEKSFTAGADIKSYLSREFHWAEQWLTQKDQLLNRGLEVWKPVISAINGFCIGGGVTLMLATDIRLAVESATFSLAEVKRGVIAANGGTQRVVHQLPYAIAMEMLLTGDAIDAQTALRWGLINRVTSRERLMIEARAIAERIAKNAPLAVQATKELAIRSRDVDLAVGLRMEQLVGRTLLQTEDAKEGQAAFKEKREPKFTAS